MLKNVIDQAIFAIINVKKIALLVISTKQYTRANFVFG